MTAALTTRTQIVVHRTVERLGADTCTDAAARAGMALHNHVRFFGASQPDELARHAAVLELACEQLRSVVGDALVDLAKVEELAAMQKRLRT